MVKVDLSEQKFNSLGITFNGKKYKLFHNEINEDKDLQEAFPEFFRVIEEPKEKEKELITNWTDKNPNETLEGPEVQEVSKGLESVIEEKVPEVNYNEIKVKNVIPFDFPTITKWSDKEFKKPFIFPKITGWSIVDYSKITPYTEEEIELPEIPEVKVINDVQEEQENKEIPKVKEIEDTEEENKEPSILTDKEIDDTEEEIEEPSILTDKEIDELLDYDYLNELKNKEPTAHDKLQEWKDGEAEREALRELKRLQKEEEGSKFELILKTVVNTGSRVVNGTMDFVMSFRFIITTAMFMVMYSAISFDIDGWRETYHRLGVQEVTFIIASLYVAKMAIIKILSVGVDKEKLVGKWSDNITFWFNHYILKGVLLTALVGMIFVSLTGIYSSLAVNTVGDAKTISLSGGQIDFINTQIKTNKDRIASTKAQIPDIDKNIQIQLKALNDSIPSIKAKIENTKVRIKELPENYKTAKRNLQIQINRMNNEIFKVQDKKAKVASSKGEKLEKINNKIEQYQTKIVKLEDNLQKAKISLNKKQVGETNKALNFTAELLGWELLTLLKFINILFTLVLEITYLALTWLVVRIDNYDTRKEEEDNESN